jgi:hypothetical protein
VLSEGRDVLCYVVGNRQNDDASKNLCPSAPPSVVQRLLRIYLKGEVSRVPESRG